MAHCWLQLFNTSVGRNNSRLENSLGRCKSINLCLLELLDTSEVRVDAGVWVAWVEFWNGESTWKLIEVDGNFIKITLLNVVTRYFWCGTFAFYSGRSWLQTVGMKLCASRSCLLHYGIVVHTCNCSCELVFFCHICKRVCVCPQSKLFRKRFLFLLISIKMTAWAKVERVLDLF